MKHKFDPATDHIKITATGANCTILAYFTNGLSTEPPTGQPVIAVAPNTFIIATPASMGYTDDKRHLCVKCSGPADGDWEIELM